MSQAPVCDPSTTPLRMWDDAQVARAALQGDELAAAELERRRIWEAQWDADPGPDMRPRLPAGGTPITNRRL